MHWVLALTLVAVAVPAGARCRLDDLLAPGRYGVGHRQVTFVDDTRGTAAWGTHPASASRTLPTEIWYPIDDASSTTPVEGAPVAAKGFFPLVMNSPGLGDLGIGEAYLGIALASRGYVVASPTFPRTNTTFLFDPAGPYLQDVVNMPGDLTFLIDRLSELRRTPGSWFFEAIEERKIGLTGLSLGGLNTLLTTFHPRLRDARVKAAAALAPAACYLSAKLFETAKPPLLLMSGDEDLITPVETNARQAFERARSPRRLVTLAKGTHTAFSALVTVPSATSYDLIGCTALEGKLTQAQIDETIAAFGPADAPYIDVAGCALPCSTPPPTSPPMTAARQHDLTQAAVVAFFESTFRKSKEAKCFLARGLAKEADVTLDRARARKLPK